MDGLDSVWILALGFLSRRGLSYKISCIGNLYDLQVPICGAWRVKKCFGF